MGLRGAEGAGGDVVGVGLGGSLGFGGRGAGVGLRGAEGRGVAGLKLADVGCIGGVHAVGDMGDDAFVACATDRHGVVGRGRGSGANRHRVGVTGLRVQADGDGAVGAGRGTGADADGVASDDVSACRRSEGDIAVALDATTGHKPIGYVLMALHNRTAAGTNGGIEVALNAVTGKLSDSTVSRAIDLVTSLWPDCDIVASV